MSLVPWPIALEPSIKTSPAFMNALTSIRRVSNPPPYELVRHSALARLPAAPLGQRLALPAADAGMAPAANRPVARPSVTRAMTALRVLLKDGAHKQSLGIALDQRVPGPGAGDERQRRHRAWREQ